MAVVQHRRLDHDILWRFDQSLHPRARWGVANPEIVYLERDPAFQLFCILDKIESQTAKFYGMEAAFKFLALTFS